MYLLILIFPLFGAIFGGFFGRYLGRDGASYITILNLFITFFLSIFLFYEICLCNAIISIKLYNVILLNIYQLEVGFLFDALSVIMILVISCISFFVHVYSRIYMSHDPYLARFMSYLSLFTFFMLLLVTSDNYFQLFIGWEGVGVCSYLLINFFFTRILANKAGLNAMIMNRIADVFFTFAILYIFITFKTTDIIVVNNLLPYIYNENFYCFNMYIKKINFITFFLFIGAIGKSAQIGFHTWLPKAMEGPTPVSALLHAATMVTAGIFLVIRSSIFFEYSNISLMLLCIFGSLTALFSGLIAIFQYDIKKIIAYSTCSQLGYMFLACGFSNYNVAFFHLFNHAFFKALLFLSAGIIIHAFVDEQDIRKIGGSYMLIYMPFIYLAILIGSLAIMGFPGLAGFYSKDILLEFVYCRFVINSVFFFFIALLAALCTTIYSVKLIFFLFFYTFNNSVFNYYKQNLRKFIESWNNMFDSILVLMFLSIMSGYLFSDMFLGLGSPFFNNAISNFTNNFSFIDVEYMHPVIKNLPILLSLLLFSLNMYIYKYLYSSKVFYKYFLTYIYFVAPFFFYGLFFDKFYNKIYQKTLLYSYYVLSKYLDKGLYEVLGPWGIYKVTKSFYVMVKKVLPSLIFSYMLIFFLSIFLLFFFIFLDLNLIHIGCLLNNLGVVFLVVFCLG